MSARYKDGDNLASFLLLYSYTVSPSKLCKIFHMTIPDFKILMNNIGRHIAFLYAITKNENISRWQNSIKIGVPLEFSDRFPQTFSLRSGSHLVFRNAVRDSIQNGQFRFNYESMKKSLHPNILNLLFIDEEKNKAKSGWFEIELSEKLNKSLSDVIEEFIVYLENIGCFVRLVGNEEYEVALSDSFVFRFGLHEYYTDEGKNQKTKIFLLKAISDGDIKVELENLLNDFFNKIQ